MTILTISLWVVSGLLVFFLVVFGIARILVHGHSPGVKLGYKVEFRMNGYIIKRVSYLPEKWLAHYGDSFLGENLSPEKEIVLIIEEVIDFLSFYGYNFDGEKKERFYYDNKKKKKFLPEEEWGDYYPLCDFVFLRQAIIYGDKEVKKIRKENKRKRKEEEKRRREAERRRVENIYQKWKEVKRL